MHLRMAQPSTGVHPILKSHTTCKYTAVPQATLFQTTGSHTAAKQSSTSRADSSMAVQDAVLLRHLRPVIVCTLYVKRYEKDKEE